MLFVFPFKWFNNFKYSCYLNLSVSLLQWYCISNFWTVLVTVSIMDLRLVFHASSTFICLFSSTSICYFNICAISALPSSNYFCILTIKFNDIWYMLKSLNILWIQKYVSRLSSYNINEFLINISLLNEDSCNSEILKFLWNNNNYSRPSVPSSAVLSWPFSVT